MNLKEFKSIRIIHDITSRIEFIFFAEFFRLCGIYVGEYIYYPNSKNEEININIEEMNSDDEFDADIYVGEGLLPESVPSNHVIYLKDVLGIELKRQIFPYITTVSDENKQELLYDMIEQLKTVLGEKGKRLNVKAFDLIAEVYIKKNLMLYCANIQYYRMKYRKQSEVANAFSGACEVLRGIGVRNEDRHITYAQLYCASKANAACFYGKYLFEYEVDDLIEECHRLIKMVPDFSNAKVLLGLICEHSPEYVRKAIRAFKDALVLEKDYSYSSHMYYWIARRYEEYENGSKEAGTYYKKAYDKKKRFRNMYKLAMIDKNHGENDSSLGYFEEILSHLKIKAKLNYLDPLEIEYCYKANSAASYICCMCTKQYEKAIKYAKEALKIHDELSCEKFFGDFYGKAQGEFIDLTEKRMDLNRIYQYLAVSYEELGKNREADMWWDKVQIN